MNIGRLLGAAAKWAWKKVIRPGLEQRGADLVADALKKKGAPHERPVQEEPKS